MSDLLLFLYFCFLFHSIVFTLVSSPLFCFLINCSFYASFSPSGSVSLMFISAFFFTLELFYSYVTIFFLILFISFFYLSFIPLFPLFYMFSFTHFLKTATPTNFEYYTVTNKHLHTHTYVRRACPKQ